MITIPDNIDDIILERIFMALGAASMCWVDVDKAGIFKSEECAAIGYDLYNELKELLPLPMFIREESNVV